MFSLYHILNQVNLMEYIGYSKCVTKRWNTHRSKLRKNCHENHHLQNAWNKYHEEVFTFEVLSVYDTQEQVIEAEIAHITKSKVDGFCYNHMPGGLGGATMTGRHHSEKTIKKMQEAHKDDRPSEECRRKSIETTKGKPSPHRGKKMSVESRQKMSNARKGKAPFNKGKPASEVTRQKIRDKRKLQIIPRSTIEAMRAVTIGHKMPKHVQEALLKGRQEAKRKREEANDNQT